MCNLNPGGLRRQDKAVKEEIMRIRVLASDRASVLIDCFHPGEGRIARIKRLRIAVRKLEEPVPRKILVEEEACNMALVIDAGGLGRVSPGHVET